MHDYHDDLPGYSPAQVLIDGCGECEQRADRPDHGISNLDRGNFALAWHRAAVWNQEGLPDLARAEMPMFRVMWAIQLHLERYGIPIGTLAQVPTGTGWPGGDRQWLTASPPPTCLTCAARTADTPARAAGAPAPAPAPAEAAPMTSPDGTRGNDTQSSGASQGGRDHGNRYAPPSPACSRCGLAMRRIALIIGWGWKCPRGHWRTA